MCQFLKKLETELPCDPTVLFPGVNPNELKAETQTDISPLIVYNSPGAEAAGYYWSRQQKGGNSVIHESQQVEATGKSITG